MGVDNFIQINFQKKIIFAKKTQKSKNSFCNSIQSTNYSQMAKNEGLKFQGRRNRFEENSSQHKATPFSSDQKAKSNITTINLFKKTVESSKFPSKQNPKKGILFGFKLKNQIVRKSDSGKKEESFFSSKMENSSKKGNVFCNVYRNSKQNEQLKMSCDSNFGKFGSHKVARLQGRCRLASGYSLGTEPFLENDKMTDENLMNENKRQIK